MMSDLIILSAIILILYARTYGYYYLIDDPVPRGGYLREMPRKVDYSFYDRKKGWLSFVTNVGVYVCVVYMVYEQWGFEAALLYAVCPLNVGGVAWNTGNYYMTTAFLVLTANYFFNHEWWWLSPVMYYGALESTVCAVPYAVWLLVTEGVSVKVGVMFIPLVIFLCGKRFRGGLKMRKKEHDRIGAQSGWYGLCVVPKVLGYYIALMFFPSRLGFFHSYGKVEDARGKLKKPSRLFLISSVLVLVFCYWSWTVDWKMGAWVILFLGVYSQLISFGMFVAERYLHTALVGFCVLLAKFLSPYPEVLAVIATLWFYRSHLYIPYWKHNVHLFSQSISAFPDTPENFNNYGLYLAERGRVTEAISPLLMGLKLSHGNKSKLHANIGMAYKVLKHYDKALFHIREAMKECPKDKYKPLRDLAFELNEKCRKHSRLMKQLKNI